MCAIPSSVFYVLVFPHEGKIVTIDQLSYTWKNHTDMSESNVPLIDQTCLVNESLGVGMHASIMGTFDLLAPISYIKQLV